MFFEIRFIYKGKRLVKSVLKYGCFSIDEVVKIKYLGLYDLVRNFLVNKCIYIGVWKYFKIILMFIKVLLLV